jgi:hypothetical protein
MSTGGNSRITAWRGLMASKGLSGAAPVLEGYGLSCEHDLSLLVQEDLNALSSQLTPFHSRILRTWVQGLAAADQHHKRDKKRAAGDVNDAPAAKKHSNAPPSAEIKEQEGTKHIAKEDEDEDEKEEDEDKDDTGDEDEDEDEDEDSDEGDEEASCGAAGEQEGVGDGKSAADVLIVGEEKAQHHNEDGKRASEGVNDAPAATQAKTTTLSTEQQSFVLKFMPKITTRHVTGRINSLKKQGARVADVKGTALTKRPQEFPGHFLSVVSGQLYCGVCHTNIGSAKTAVRQHTEGKEHIQKVHSKVAGSDRGTEILECITAYKVMVIDSTGGQEPVGFERVPENVQV